MIRSCCIPGCKAIYPAAIYSFPYHDRELTKAWVDATSDPVLLQSNCTSTNCEHHGVCERHFEERFYMPGPFRLCYGLAPNAVPTLHLPSAKMKGELKQYNMYDIFKYDVFEPGVPNTILRYLKIVSEKISEKDKYCILTFDEIELRPKLHYNETRDLIEGFSDTGEKRYRQFADRALVFMACGLKQQWELPLSFIFYHEDIELSALLSALKKQLSCTAGLKIIGVVCPQNTTNTAIIKDLVKLEEDEKYIPCYNIPDKYNEGSFLVGATVKMEIPFKDTSDLLLQNFNREPMKRFLKKIRNSCKKNKDPHCRKFILSYRHLSICLISDMVRTTLVCTSCHIPHFRIDPFFTDED